MCKVTDMLLVVSPHSSFLTEIMCVHDHVSTLMEPPTR